MISYDSNTELYSESSGILAFLPDSAESLIERRLIQIEYSNTVYSVYMQQRKNEYDRSAGCFCSALKSLNI